MAGVGACSPRRPPGIVALFHSRESAAGSNDAQPPPISFVARLRHVQASKAPRSGPLIQGSRRSQATSGSNPAILAAVPGSQLVR